MFLRHGVADSSRTAGGFRAMFYKLVRRCFSICLRTAALIFVALAVCGLLAWSQPRFYDSAQGATIDQADVAAAMKELEQLGQSLQLFISLDGVDAEQLRALAAMDRPETQPGKKNHTREMLAALDRAPDVTGDTFKATLTERQLNAWLSREMGARKRQWRRPHLALQGDLIRCGVAVETPVTEVVISCDVKLAKASARALTLELHAVRVGLLPLPAATILKQFVRTKPTLPRGVELNVDGARPTLTFTELPVDGLLQLDGIRVVDGEVRLTLRRTSDVVAAR